MVIEKKILLRLLAHWGDLIEQIKKVCHVHFKVRYKSDVVAMNFRCNSKGSFEYLITKGTLGRHLTSGINSSRLYNQKYR